MVSCTYIKLTNLGRVGLMRRWRVVWGGDEVDFGFEFSLLAEGFLLVKEENAQFEG